MKPGKQCPQGSCDYDKPPRRNRDLENIIEKSDFGLKCSKTGCNVELTREKLAKHELKCEFRMVPCPYTGCSKRIIVRDLKTCLESHKPMRIDNAAGIMKHGFALSEDILASKLIDWFPVLCTDPNGLEFYHQFLKRNGLWYCWVKVKTDPEAAAKFNFSVKVENVKTGFKMEFCGQVHPIDDSVEEIMASGNFLLMQTENIKKVINRDKVEILFSVVPK